MSTILLCDSDYALDQFSVSFDGVCTRASGGFRSDAWRAGAVRPMWMARRPLWPVLRRTGRVYSSYTLVSAEGRPGTAEPTPFSVAHSPGIGHALSTSYPDNEKERERRERERERRTSDRLHRAAALPQRPGSAPVHGAVSVSHAGIV